jgi:hypothetical protein
MLIMWQELNQLRAAKSTAQITHPSNGLVSQRTVLLWTLLK